MNNHRPSDAAPQIRSKYLAFGRPDLTEAEIEAVARVMRSGWLGMGEETLAFERELAAYLDTPEVVTVNSCTSALFLALLVAGIGPGDEVIVPSLTWCATANAALYLGATPVFCDVDPDTMVATTESVLACLTSRTKAVIVVHFGGHAIDVAHLRAALPEQVVLVEDAAHALGSRYPNGRPVGSSGNLVCFSFYANKNLSTADGGAIALFDPELAERLRRLRMSGMDSHAWSRYIRPSTAITAGIEELGYKMNFTDLQASIGRVQLARMGEMSARRRELVRRYQAQVAARGVLTTFQAGSFLPEHAHHLLVARFDAERIGMSRDDLLLALRQRNIGASVHYRPLHLMPLYQPYVRGRLAATEALYEQIMTLPISSAMTAEDVDYVVEHLAQLTFEKAIR